MGLRHYKLRTSAPRMTHFSSPNATPHHLKCLWFAEQMPVVCGAEVWHLGRKHAAFQMNGKNKGGHPL